MRFLFVVAAAVVSVFMMLLITRIIGSRQISELSLYDYVNSITFGSIAADLAIAPDPEEALYCLIGLVVYGIFTLLFAVITTKSKKMRTVLEGRPILLMHKGKLYREAFKKARLDLNEFNALCRGQGYFDPAKIDTAIMEINGKVSIIPKGGDRAATPADLNIPVATDPLTACLILDGFVQQSTLKKLGKDEAWLQAELKTNGIKNPGEVFLASYDGSTVTVFKRGGEHPVNYLN